MGTRLAYYSRGPNPLFFSQDSDKLTSNVPLEPSLYLLLMQLTAKPKNPSDEPFSTDAVKVYIKQNVETFLFRGADLMWPGVLTSSTRDFKANSTGVVYAHKALVTKYISSLLNRPKANEE
jgi:predicted ribosome-associated RNA-binding protein Tma20